MAYKNFKAAPLNGGGFVMLPYLLVGVGIYLLWKPIQGLISGAGMLTDTLGLTKSDNDELVQKLSVNTSSAWSPQFYKNAPKGSKLITKASAETLCDKITAAAGLFLYMDTGEALAIFKNLKTQSQVSFLADIFQQKENYDLLQYLDDGNYKIGLSDTGLKTITDYVSNLPKY
jgi:hypothetical protein